MFNVVTRVRVARELRRLRREARLDNGPAATLRLCRRLAELGKGEEMVRAGRAGLDRFPHAQELQDLVRESFETYGKEHLTFLEFQVDRRPNLGNYAELVRGYLHFEQLRPAGLAGREMARRFPNAAEARAVYGGVLLARFREEHMRHDGERAIAEFRRGTELDPSSAASRRGLAETYAEIGATSQAMFHLLLALDLAPDDAIAVRLYDELRKLPFERRKESDLLWETEANDGSPVRKNSRSGTDPVYFRELVGGMRRLSRIDGVRRVALSQGEVELIAKDDRCMRLPERETDPFLRLAVGFRTAASRCTKRVGMGSFQQADLRFELGRVLAVAAGPAVLMLAVAGDPDVAQIAREARNQLASWTQSRKHEELVWSRT